MYEQDKKNYDVLYSMLTDGELTSDEVNELLLEAFNDENLRMKLIEHLKLRSHFAGIRNSQPPAEMLLSCYQDTPGNKTAKLRWWHVTAAAAVLLIVALVGYFVGASYKDGVSRDPAIATGTDETLELRKTFSFYESAAGPVEWMVDSKNDISVKPADGKSASGSPIGLIVQMKGNSGGPKTYRIVIRDGLPATIPLAGLARQGQTAQLVLNPQKTQNGIKLGYTLVIDPGNSADVAAVLGGEKRLTSAESVLGQLPVDGNDISVTVRKINL